MLLISQQWQLALGRKPLIPRCYQIIKFWKIAKQNIFWPKTSAFDSPPSFYFWLSKGQIFISVDFCVLSRPRKIYYFGQCLFFCSFWVCARQISHVRNEGNSENSTTRDWWLRETLSIWLINHFSDLHLFQNRLIFFVFQIYH